MPFGLRARFFEIDFAEQGGVASLDGSHDVDAVAVFTCTVLHLCLAWLYGDLREQLHDLAANLKQTTAVTRRHRLSRELEQHRVDVSVHSNPVTAAMPWELAEDASTR